MSASDSFCTAEAAENAEKIQKTSALSARSTVRKGINTKGREHPFQNTEGECEV